MRIAAKLLPTPTLALALITSAAAYPTGDEQPISHNGLTYYVGNPADRDQFIDLGRRYAPQYGGLDSPCRGPRAAMYVTEPAADQRTESPTIASVDRPLQPDRAPEPQPKAPRPPTPQSDPWRHGHGHIVS